MGSTPLKEHAEARRRAGFLKEALAVYREVVAQHADDWGALLACGDLCAQTGEIPQAIHYYRLVAEGAPSFWREANPVDPVTSWLYEGIVLIVAGLSEPLEEVPFAAPSIEEGPALAFDMGGLASAATLAAPSIEEGATRAFEMGGEVSAGAEEVPLASLSIERGATLVFDMGGEAGTATPELPANVVNVPIWYATDRKPAKPTFASGERAVYLNEPGTRLSLGRCLVTIPPDHRMGSLESASFWRLEFRSDPARHVTLLSVDQLPEGDFYSLLRAAFSRTSEAAALVFIHGYNVTFDDAARRTAQLAYDLHYPGLAVLYSWASHGKPMLYTHDETTVERTIPHLRTFLAKLASLSGIKTIHLIAHSMGNRALIHAVHQLFLDAATQPPPRFQEVVLAAPDIDAVVFRQLAGALQLAAERLTLYASKNDQALELSKRFHGYQRAGDTQPAVVIVPGVDTIDASAVDTSFMHHSYYGESRSILADVFHLIRNRLPPSRRAGLRSAQSGGLAYWVFQP